MSSLCLALISPPWAEREERVLERDRDRGEEKEYHCDENPVYSFFPFGLLGSCYLFSRNLLNDVPPHYLIHVPTIL